MPPTSISYPTRPGAASGLPHQMLNKVPEVLVTFWIIKILATTVGETAADYLSTTLGFGLTWTTVVMSLLLAAALTTQFRLRRYVPAVYWLTVVLVSVVGTLITDNLTDRFGISLVTTTIIFTALLIGVFVAWWASERTLSIHTIVTRRREGFYWLAVLVTFALGTAADDLIAERMTLGYWPSALLFGGSIALVFLAHRGRLLAAIPAFWAAYILTRPLGASIGDGLSQARADGGLGLGTTATTMMFLITIVSIIAYLTVGHADRTPGAPVDAVSHSDEADAESVALPLTTRR